MKFTWWPFIDITFVTWIVRDSGTVSVVGAILDAFLQGPDIAQGLEKVPALALAPLEAACGGPRGGAKAKGKQCDYCQAIHCRRMIDDPGGPLMGFNSRCNCLHNNDGIEPSFVKTL